MEIVTEIQFFTSTTGDKVSPYKFISVTVSLLLPTAIPKQIQMNDKLQRCVRLLRITEVERNGMGHISY